MSLQQKILDDLTRAMKSRDEALTRVLRSIKASLLEKEISTRKGGKSVSLSDELTTDVLVKAAKQRKDSLTQFRDAGRDDLADIEEAELAIIENYLPKQLTEQEIRQLVEDAVAKTGAASPQDMGKVMGVLMPQVKGKADGALVSKIVRETLGAS
ncbi:MAG: GatB/YqeY domain-containing protein [Rhodothermaceae bacterium]|nr:GatB/YqeY domain-containing protein [Rhodothermaceae bacterium]